jgi:hypothetical protein
MNKVNFASLPNISSESNLQLSEISNLKYLRRTAFSMSNLYTIVSDGQEEPSSLTDTQELTPAPAPPTKDVTQRRRKSLWSRTKTFMRRMLCCDAHS